MLSELIHCNRFANIIIFTNNPLRGHSFGNNLLWLFFWLLHQNCPVSRQTMWISPEHEQGSSTATHIFLNDNDFFVFSAGSIYQTGAELFWWDISLFLCTREDQSTWFRFFYYKCAVCWICPEFKGSSRNTEEGILKLNTRTDPGSCDDRGNMFRLHPGLWRCGWGAAGEQRGIDSSWGCLEMKCVLQ